MKQLIIIVTALLIAAYTIGAVPVPPPPQYCPPWVDPADMDCTRPQPYPNPIPYPDPDPPGKPWLLFDLTAKVWELMTPPERQVYYSGR